MFCYFVKLLNKQAVAFMGQTPLFSKQPEEIIGCLLLSSC